MHVNYLTYDETTGEIRAAQQAPENRPAPVPARGAIVPCTDEELNVLAAFQGRAGYDSGSSNFSARWEPGRPIGSRVVTVDNRPLIRFLEMPSESSISALDLARNDGGGLVDVGVEVVDENGTRRAGINVTRVIVTEGRRPLRLAFSAGLAVFQVDERRSLMVRIPATADFALYGGAPAFPIRVIGSVID